VKNQFFGSDPKVVVFNFKSHFNDGPNNDYSNYVCPPPHDTDTAPQFILDANTSSPNFGQMAWMCDDGSHIPTNFLDAILARAPDQGHLSSAGAFQVLQPYIDKCVRNYLGLSGGSQAACN
jgi:hypothetical protein